jgi:hypothetical protein
MWLAKGWTIRFPAVAGIFLFATSSKLALRPTLSPVRTCFSLYHVSFKPVSLPAGRRISALYFVIYIKFFPQQIVIIGIDRCCTFLLITYNVHKITSKVELISACSYVDDKVFCFLNTALIRAECISQPWGQQSADRGRPCSCHNNSWKNILEYIIFMRNWQKRYTFYSFTRDYVYQKCFYRSIFVVRLCKTILLTDINVSDFAKVGSKSYIRNVENQNCHTRDLGGYIGLSCYARHDKEVFGQRLCECKCINHIVTL